MKSALLCGMLMLTGCAGDALDTWNTGGGGEKQSMRIRDYDVDVWTERVGDGLYASRSLANGGMLVNRQNHIVVGIEAIDRVAQGYCPNGYDLLSEEWHQVQYHVIYRCRS